MITRLTEILIRKKEDSMKLSARNMLRGRVEDPHRGRQLWVTIELRGGEEIVSIITNSSVERLGLMEGRLS
jgi:molybdopterin-binding protein